jgi:hypothetical protein
MECKNCNWYSKEHWRCVKHDEFEFASAPPCEDFKENEIVEVLPKEGK